MVRVSHSGVNISHAHQSSLRRINHDKPPYIGDNSGYTNIEEIHIIIINMPIKLLIHILLPFSVPYGSISMISDSGLVQGNVIVTWLSELVNVQPLSP